MSLQGGQGCTSFKSPTTPNRKRRSSFDGLYALRVCKAVNIFTTCIRLLTPVEISAGFFAEHAWSRAFCRYFALTQTHGRTRRFCFAILCITENWFGTRVFPKLVQPVIRLMDRQPVIRIIGRQPVIGIVAALKIPRPPLRLVREGRWRQYMYIIKRLN